MMTMIKLMPDDRLNPNIYSIKCFQNLLESVDFCLHMITCKTYQAGEACLSLDNFSGVRDVEERLPQGDTAFSTPSLDHRSMEVSDSHGRVPQSPSASYDSS